MSDEIQDYMNFFGVISTAAVTVIGFLLSRMIKKVDERLESLTNSVVKVVTEIEVSKEKHQRNVDDVQFIFDKLKENDEQVKEIRDSVNKAVHDANGAKNQVKQFLTMFNKLEGKVESIEDILYKKN
jgi:methyl-accepting chemotaxis protein